MTGLTGKQIRKCSTCGRCACSTITDRHGTRDIRGSTTHVTRKIRRNGRCGKIARSIALYDRRSRICICRSICRKFSGVNIRCSRTADSTHNCRSLRPSYVTDKRASKARSVATDVALDLTCECLCPADRLCCRKVDEALRVRTGATVRDLQYPIYFTSCEIYRISSRATTLEFCCLDYSATSKDRRSRTERHRRRRVRAGCDAAERDIGCGHIRPARSSTRATACKHLPCRARCAICK